MTDALLVLTTLPNADAAAELAKTVVAEKLAACANLFPALRSVYRWQAKVQDENEVLAIPIEQGYQGYLEWLARETG